MQPNQLKLVSLNVNGLNDVKKRRKVFGKLKKEKAEINYLQETHLSDQEHEKLKKEGFKNTYYSSFRGSNKRGVVILISNKTPFEFLSEVKDKEGRYILVKGRVEEQLVTFINV